MKLFFWSIMYFSFINDGMKFYFLELGLLLENLFTKEIRIRPILTLFIRA